MSIQSFQCMDTASFFDGCRVKRFESFERVAMRKLAMLDAAKVLQDLRIPPGNRLEALAGDRRGQHSIRINDQFRVCFIWLDVGPAAVEICDYH
ncbi:type II toxin-antitoxin system RelE/ParE family toxin [Stenotrophomonas sp. CFBP8980]|jgi:proteic killer suppression protein|uniref:type II toxin-antitoxin system RelE/ParE family toxin n=1 Tax=Stenotrophomonas sp. CFBP8980 TaxID=3096523 RepID=UPI002A6B7B92|nr:type II toxin-antitoxin system RelE/ParE family toxin [Stenotrophomonas sp. CFBP8980]MDY1033281.1 type II toxin-antitoxin system RelE/ParE family toxin [Stenotrophomonas sp. CFBP8980]